MVHRQAYGRPGVVGNDRHRRLGPDLRRSGGIFRCLRAEQVYARIGPDRGQKLRRIEKELRGRKQRALAVVVKVVVAHLYFMLKLVHRLRDAGVQEKRRRIRQIAKECLGPVEKERKIVFAPRGA